VVECPCDRHLGEVAALEAEAFRRRIQIQGDLIWEARDALADVLRRSGTAVVSEDAKPLAELAGWLVRTKQATETRVRAALRDALVPWALGQ
jgi:hypothetical protein